MMRAKNVMMFFLILESLFVLIGTLMKQDMWVGIVCYWTILLMKHICDLMDEKRDRNGRRKGTGQV